MSGGSQPTVTRLGRSTRASGVSRRRSTRSSDTRTAAAPPSLKPQLFPAVTPPPRPPPPSFDPAAVPGPPPPPCPKPRRKPGQAGRGQLRPGPLVLGDEACL